ncbi:MULTISPECIES: helix-turn-helix transcriptional regulator [Oscillospiraceae]|jgi:transcriptional regulator with XRE-family HTH domain|nr:helix-turn-helix transcriptional regulator [Dysosmobacter sp.]MDR3803434.1 helix-turn-helix transcriptional regulator [Dysosmobacter sp.]MDR3948016.1 helix-turn-helix transcriptional regulator [Dysosmobacter sp.]MDR3984678.1 helix-turn-helix transcriptional regulator [Dysosmobacter sp.]
MKIGSRLKALRKERRETQLQVAQAVGMGDRHYQRVENDEGLPGLEIFSALADHFGVSMDYLAGRTDRRDVWK